MWKNLESSDMPNRVPKEQKMVSPTEAVVIWLAVVSYIVTCDQKLWYQAQAKN